MTDARQTGTNENGGTMVAVLMPSSIGRRLSWRIYRDERTTDVDEPMGTSGVGVVTRYLPFVVDSKRMRLGRARYIDGCVDSTVA